MTKALTATLAVLSVLGLSLPLSAQAWTRSVTDLPSTSSRESAAAYDAARNQIVVFGGSNRNNETWVWDESGWTQMFPSTTPPGRQDSAMAYDESRQYVVMFGGEELAGQLSDTWVWDGSEWKEDGSFWTEGRGTQTEAFTMAEGVIVFNDDGSINFAESQITHYLKVDPRADVAGTALDAGFAASTAQMQAVTQLISALVPMLRPVPEPSPGPF